MAFGGVETGNMKEKEVTKVGGSIISNGLMDWDSQTNGAIIGSKILAEATLEAT